MNIEEAIDCLSEEAQNLTGLDIDYRFKALSLSIQALILIQTARKLGYSLPAKLLLGETED